MRLHSVTVGCFSQLEIKSECGRRRREASVSVNCGLLFYSCPLSRLILRHRSLKKKKNGRGKKQLTNDIKAQQKMD